MFNSKRLWLLLAGLVLAAVPARASAPGTYASATSDCSVPTTATIAVSAGQLVVAWSTSGGVAATFTFTDSASQTYSVATGPLDNSGRSGEMAYVANSAALTSVSTTASSGVGCTLLVAAYSGMATANVLDVAAIQGGGLASSTTCLSPSITTTNASDVIVGTCDVRVAETWTAGGTGCTSTVETTAAGGEANSALQDCNSVATGTFQAQFGMSASNKYLGAIAAFKQAGGGPPPCPKTLMMIGVGC